MEARTIMVAAVTLAASAACTRVIVESPPTQATTIPPTTAATTTTLPASVTAATSSVAALDADFRALDRALRESEQFLDLDGRQFQAILAQPKGSGRTTAAGDLSAEYADAERILREVVVYTDEVQAIVNHYVRAHDDLNSAMRDLLRAVSAEDVPKADAALNRVESAWDRRAEAIAFHTKELRRLGFDVGS